ncbi:hypothetical protein MRX96_029889 [Rhipicephalus microplus]
MLWQKTTTSGDEAGCPMTGGPGKLSSTSTNDPITPSAHLEQKPSPNGLASKPPDSRPSHKLVKDTKGISLLSEARGGVLHTRAMQTKFTASTPTICHCCNAAEETIQHVVLECTGLQPGPPLQQANPCTLAMALGIHEQGAPLQLEVEQGAPPQRGGINAVMAGALVAHRKSASMRCQVLAIVYRSGAYYYYYLNAEYR